MSFCLCNSDESEQWIYRLEFPERPWTTNAERKGNRWDRANETRHWRTAFYALALKEKIPPMSWVSITVEPHQKGGRSQDVGACHPSVKAAIDGIVDAKVIEDDSPKFLRSLIYLPPEKDRNALVLYIRGSRKERKI